jgi:hypothetical protein
LSFKLPSGCIKHGTIADESHYESLVGGRSAAHPRTKHDMTTRHCTLRSLLSKGLRIRTRALRRAVFVCSQCGVDRTGHVIQRQRWLGTGSLPIVPLAVVERGVRCDTCDHVSDLGALEVPTSAQLSILLETGYRHALATVIRADSMTTVDRRIARAAIRAMDGIGFEYDTDTMVHDLLTTSDTDTSAHLHTLVDEMTAHGKQGFLHRLTLVALADGSLSSAERLALARVGISLGMASPHIQGVVAVACANYEAA